MYGSLARCDQRAKGEQYVRGLLLEGRRKSIQPMAARLPDGDEQGLQQFITDSPWRDAPVRRRLAVRMTAEIGPEGWVVDDTGSAEGRPVLAGRGASVLRGVGEDRELSGAGVGQRRDRPRRRVRWGGGCFCPSPGIGTRIVASARGSLRMSVMSRSGSSRWGSSMSCSRGGLRASGAGRWRVRRHHRVPQGFGGTRA